MIDYYNKHFAASATASGDTVSVEKGGGSDWVQLKMSYNPNSTPVIFDLRNRQIVEHLHFMLGQFLRETT
ncbi:hypothetical protein UFOVP275_6 [uncultured Caudovirales phage]|uniref:Uncharacterized protein n=1 Tax=uncultured Caudovirales phage TaxID=2100421 RepID=A0A6J5LKK2_9CAUD|nr:hypothetical protein UFOVP275_6 [uncultured Caudovirales phage]